MKAAEYIAKSLRDRGVKFVFGIPGGPSIPYISALKKEGIEFILTSNETAAGIMADVTGRLSGIPGVCHATFGPGATNLSTGVGGALLDRSPLIAFTSEMPEKLRKRTVQMNIDHQALFESLTKATVSLNRNNLPEAISDAFLLAQAEYPGPVHLGLPSDLAEKNIENSEISYTEKAKKEKLNIDSELLDLLKYSRKPLLALGNTARRLDMREEIERFLDKCPMPVVLTPMAKGLVDERSEHYCGVLFHASSDILKEIVNEADLIIGFGYDPVEYNYESWISDIPLVHISTVPADMPTNIMAKQLNGNIEGVLEIIAAAVNKPLNWNPGIISDCRKKMESRISDTADTFSPFSIIKSLKKYLPPDNILCLDVGSHIHLFGQYWDIPSTDQLIMTNGWSGMGFAIPAAIATALNKPDAPVVCITGDGGFLMTCGEIMTARRLNLDILFIVLADRELNLIKIKEQRQGIQNMAVDLYDGQLIGENSFLGVPVSKCIDSESLNNLLSDIFPFSGPAIIELYIDPADYEKVIIS